MSDHYILNPDHTVSETDLFTWAEQFSTIDRTVRKTVVRGMYVSTVFLGLNHNYGDGPPEIFETMVFEGSFNDQFCERCSTWEQALEMHKRGERYARFNELYRAYAWLQRACYKARTWLTRAFRRDQ